MRTISASGTGAHRAQRVKCDCRAQVKCDYRAQIKCHYRAQVDRKSTRLNSSHLGISYAVFCLKKKNETIGMEESRENTDHCIAQFAKSLEQNNIGWAFWPYKKSQKTSAVLSISPPAD